MRRPVSLLRALAAPELLGADAPVVFSEVDYSSLPPLFPPNYKYFVDPLLGDDGALGDRAHPLRTKRAVVRRLAMAAIQETTTITFVGRSMGRSTDLARYYADEWRPTFARELLKASVLRTIITRT